MKTRNDDKKTVNHRKQVIEIEDFLIFHESGIPLYHHIHDDDHLPLNDPVLKGGFLSAMMQFARPYTADAKVLYDFGVGKRRVFLMYNQPYYFALTIKKIKSSTKYETLERNVKKILNQAKLAFNDLLNESSINIMDDDKELETFKNSFEAKFNDILIAMGFSVSNND